MSRPTLKALYLKDGSPSDALLSALTALRCPSLEELQRRVKRGKVDRAAVLGARLGGSHYRPGVVALYLFGKTRARMKRTAAKPRVRRSVASPAPVAPLPVLSQGDDDHERDHLCLFTD